jgi:hypothetical protein
MQFLSGQQLPNKLDFKFQQNPPEMLARVARFLPHLRRHSTAGFLTGVVEACAMPQGITVRAVIRQYSPYGDILPGEPAILLSAAAAQAHWTPSPLAQNLRPSVQVRRPGRRVVRSSLGALDFFPKAAWT